MHRKTLAVAAAFLTTIAGMSIALADEFADLINQHSGVSTDVVAYENVTLIDINAGQARPGVTIVVNGERIESVSSAADAQVGEVDRTVDASGWYALPGLVDAHVHLATLPDRDGAEAILNRHVYGGVTSVRDMAGDVRALADLERSALLNQVNSPDIHYSALMAGPSFFADQRTVMAALGHEPGTLPWMRSMTEETDIRQAVAEAKGSGASGIKIYANLGPDLVAEIVTEATRQGFPVWSHAKIYPTTPLQTIEPGMTAVSHVCMLADHALDPERTEYRRPNSSESSLDYTEVTANHPRISEAIDAMASGGTFFDATLSVYEWSDENRPADDDPRASCSFELGASITNAAANAGVRIVAGTDVVAEAEDELPSLLHEIELMVSAAGMSNIDALRAATINAAAMLGLADQLGSVDEGKYASIVFTSRNPLDDIANLRSVQLTLKRGRSFLRSDYVHQDIPQE